MTRLEEALVRQGVQPYIATVIALGLEPGADTPMRYLLRLADACESAAEEFGAVSACARKSGRAL